MKPENIHVWDDVWDYYSRNGLRNYAHCRDNAKFVSDRGWQNDFDFVLPLPTPSKAKGADPVTIDELCSGSCASFVFPEAGVRIFLFTSLQDRDLIRDQFFSLWEKVE